MRFQHYIYLLLCSFAPQKKCRGDLNGMISKTLVKGQIDQLSLPPSLSLCIAIPKVKLRVTNSISGNPLKQESVSRLLQMIFTAYFQVSNCSIYGAATGSSPASFLQRAIHPGVIWVRKKFPEIKNRALVLKCSLCLFKTATETIQFIWIIYVSIFYRCSR